MKRIVVLIAVSAVYVLLGHLNWWPGNEWNRPRGFELARPEQSGGDEPHYLMVTASLLFDHDIRLDADLARVRAGGYEAGAGMRGAKIGAHSYLVEPRSGRHITCIEECDPKEVETLGGRREEMFQVPSHPAAYPAFMAAFAWPFRPSAKELEPLVGTFSIFVSLAGVFLTYACARKSGLAEKPAVVAAALAGFASPWVVYLRSYFSDPSIGLFLLLGFLALRSRRMVLAGMGVGVAMAMKPVFVLFGFAWVAERLVARRFREAFVLAASTGACGVALLAVNLVTLRTPVASGALPLAVANSFTPLWETFFDVEHGLFTFVPWTIVAFAWALPAMRRGYADAPGLLDVEARRQIMVPIFLCVGVFACLAFGPGWCFGPRYYVPLFPLLAIVAADFAFSGPRWRLGIAAALGAVALVIALPSVPQYHFLFSRRPFAALTSL